MIGKVVAVAAKTFEAGNKVAEIGAKAAEVNKKGVDIGKRVDVTKNKSGFVEKGVDIGKRIVPKEMNPIREIASKDISEAIGEYLTDLKSKSVFGDMISKDYLKPEKLVVQPADIVKELRGRFVIDKDKIRTEWEKINNREWPKYKEDILNGRGEVIKKAGDNYDAHHIQPLKLGGTNEVSNIMPLDTTKHMDIHSNSGSCKKLVDAVEGARP